MKSIELVFAVVSRPLNELTNCEIPLGLKLESRKQEVSRSMEVLKRERDGSGYLTNLRDSWF